MTSNLSEVAVRSQGKGTMALAQRHEQVGRLSLSWMAITHPVRGKASTLSLLLWPLLLGDK